MGPARRHQIRATSVLVPKDAKHQPAGQGAVVLSLKPAKGDRPRPRWHSAQPHLMPTSGMGGDQLPGRARMNDANHSPRLKHQEEHSKYPYSACKTVVQSVPFKPNLAYLFIIEIVDVKTI